MKRFSKRKNDRTRPYGGTLMTTRRGRMGPRPLSTTQTMHLVMRSSKARGAWSFKKGRNERKVGEIVRRFAGKYGVRVIKMAVVLNHLHLQIKVESRKSYRAFIRAISAAIAMAITGASRWSPLKKGAGDRFWDRRPFTRIVIGLRHFINLQNYIEINQLEGLGYNRIEAKIIISENSS